MHTLLLRHETYRRPQTGLRRGASLPRRSTKRSRRTLGLVILLAAASLLVGCTDQLDLTGLPTSCKDSTGKDVAVRVEMRITRPGQLMALDTMTVNSKGEADLMIGAGTQSKSLLKSGHRPMKPEPNVIYTGDPVSIELKLKDPCKPNTKMTTIVL